MAECGPSVAARVGVINMTPDSFSDGGRFSGPEQAADVAQQMVDGRRGLARRRRRIHPPGALRRSGGGTNPANRAGHHGHSPTAGLTISIDTSSSPVAERAVDAGANIVNDVSAGRQDPDMLPLVARRRLPVVLMHMQGTPRPCRRLQLSGRDGRGVGVSPDRRMGRSKRGSIRPDYF